MSNGWELGSKKRKEIVYREEDVSKVCIRVMEGRGGRKLTKSGSGWRWMRMWIGAGWLGTSYTEWTVE